MLWPTRFNYLIVITEKVFKSAGGSLKTTNFEYLEKSKSTISWFQVFQKIKKTIKFHKRLINFLSRYLIFSKNK
jgi:hypothetical protein